jgi:hypothetical protein
MNYNNPMQSGRDAFLTGKDISENPCDRRTHANHSNLWDKGWIEQSKRTCRGRNCKAINGNGHSLECLEDHEKCYDGIID